METFLNFLSSNKEWLFSGVGASAIIGSVAYIFKTKQDPEKTQTQTVSQNVTVNVNSEKEASTKALNTKSIDKESISILFIDDQTFDSQCKTNRLSGNNKCKCNFCRRKWGGNQFIS